MVTTRFKDKNTKTDISINANIDTDEDGGIALPMLKLVNIVVINIEVFKPIRKPTDPKSVKLNKNEIADTTLKTISGKRLAKALDGLSFACVIAISA